MSHSLEETLSRSGMRVTAQRRWIAQVLGRSSDHPSAEMIHRRLRECGRPVSLATIYRTLRFLCQSGVVQAHEFGDGVARFEPDRGDEHGHLVDLASGEVSDFADDQLNRLLCRIAMDRGYERVAARVSILARPLALSSASSPPPGSRLSSPPLLLLGGA